MSESESTPAPLGASDAPILTENGSREAKYAPFNPGSDAGVGSDGGVAAHTRHWVRLSRKTKKQKAKLAAIAGWVYEGEGAAALSGPLKVAVLIDITATALKLLI